MSSFKIKYIAFSVLSYDLFALLDCLFCYCCFFFETTISCLWGLLNFPVNRKVTAVHIISLVVDKTLLCEQWFKWLLIFVIKYYSNLILFVFAIFFQLYYFAFWLLLSSVDTMVFYIFQHEMKCILYMWKNLAFSIRKAISVTSIKILQVLY